MLADVPSPNCQSMLEAPDGELKVTPTSGAQPLVTLADICACNCLPVKSNSDSSIKLKRFIFKIDLPEIKSKRKILLTHSIVLSDSEAARTVITIIGHDVAYLRNIPIAI